MEIFDGNRIIVTWVDRVTRNHRMDSESGIHLFLRRLGLKSESKSDKKNCPLTDTFFKYQRIFLKFEFLAHFR